VSAKCHTICSFQGFGCKMYDSLRLRLGRKETRNEELKLLEDSEVTDTHDLNGETQESIGKESLRLNVQST